MKLYEAVSRALIALGVERLFGVMGDANMRYIATYRDVANVTYVGAAHEAGAVAMADGYSRLAQRLGVATVTHGPGVTNALTAITEAVRAHTPVVVLTGSTPPQGDHPQWLDLRAAAQLAGAGFHQVRSPDSVGADIVQSARDCLLTRRPVLLDIPAAIMASEVSEFTADDGLATWRRSRTVPSEEQLDAAIGIIASADRPLILIGRGAVLSGARDEIYAFAEALRAPVANSVLALNYLEGYPLDLGIFGSESHSLAIKYISQSDCIIVLGAGLNHFTTANGDLLRNKAIVRCDDMPLVVESGPGTVPMLSDVKLFVQAVTDAIRAMGDRADRVWSRQLRDELQTFNPVDDFVDTSDAEYIDIRTAMVALSEVLPEHCALVTDTGRFKTAPWRFLRCSSGSFARSGSFSAIGLGLPMAIGASFAQPDRPTVAAVGDGGLMMSLPELATAVEHSLPLLVAVANDGCYGNEYRKLVEYGHDPKHALRAWPSFAATAKAFGVAGEVIATRADFEKLRLPLAGLSSPMLLDIRIDPAVNSRKYR